MMGRTVLVAGLAASAVAAPAQDAAKTATLLQISAERAPGESDRDFSARIDRFRAAIGGVTSCEAAMRVAVANRTSVRVRSSVPLTTLPAPLREQLARAGEGRPTPLFGTRAAVRVLLSCPASFRDSLPKPPPKPGRTG